MDEHIEKRLASVLERRRETQSHDKVDVDDPSHARRLAHNRLIVELPRVSAKITSVVALLNDRLYDAGLWLKVDLADHTPIAEAIYTISVCGSDRETPSLVMTIDYTGSIRCMLKNNGTRTLVRSYAALAMDSEHIMDMIVTLLEAHYH